MCLASSIRVLVGIDGGRSSATQLLWLIYSVGGWREMIVSSEIKSLNQLSRQME